MKRARQYFGTDGVRGIPGETLPDDLVEGLGRAFALTRAGTVLVGRDTRESGPRVEAALARGLASGGAEARLGGILPTPAVALLSDDAGAVVSASHNPPEWNGVKFFEDGHKLTDESEEEIEARLDDAAAPEPGRIEEATGLAERYVSLVCERFGAPLDGLRIAVDCAYGAMWEVAPAALGRLGASVTPICAEPDGAKINVGCGATDLGRLRDTVRAGDLDLGVALDGDGDRVLAVDAAGQKVDGDGILAVLAPYLGVELVAVTEMTNLGFDRLMKRHGIRVLPGVEASAVSVSEHRDLLDGLVRHGLPDPAVVERAFDRLALMARADAHGLTSPPTVVCTNQLELEEACAEYGFPVLLKPRRGVVLHGNGLRPSASRLVHRPEQVEVACRAFGFPLLVHRREDEAIVYSFAGLAAADRMLAVAFARYDRTWPPDAGNASCAETLVPPDDLVDRVHSLVQDLAWEGIFELELLGVRGGYAAIDFNPRVYGSLALAVRAGANLPALWCKWLASGETPPSPVVALPGFRYRLEDAELRNFLTMIRDGRLAGALKVLRPRRRVAHAYFRWSDPAPMVARMLEIAVNRHMPEEVLP